MTTLLLIAVVLLCTLGVFGALAVALWGRGDSTPVQVYIAGTILLALKVVLGMLQTELASRATVKRVDATTRKVEEASRRTQDKIDVMHEDTRQIVAQTQVQVGELLDRTTGSLTDAVREAGEQARLGERDQVIAEVTQSRAFRDLLKTVADSAVRAADARRGA